MIAAEAEFPPVPMPDHYVASYHASFSEPQPDPDSRAQSRDSRDQGELSSRNHSGDSRGSERGSERGVSASGSERERERDRSKSSRGSDRNLVQAIENQNDGGLGEREGEREEEKKDTMVVYKATSDDVEEIRGRVAPFIGTLFLSLSPSLSYFSLTPSSSFSL
jgi:transposase